LNKLVLIPHFKKAYKKIVGRIPRDNEMLMNVEVEGLFPCGEGVGYAGGIVSAAIDGERSADAIKKSINN
jgi:uncharacterized FAD-dependent dehydrogenase